LDDGRVRRYVRRALIAAGGVVVAWELMMPIALGYGTTHIVRPVVPVANLGTGYEDVSFRTSDGLDLEGWYIPSRNGAAVIAFPGRNGPQKQTRFLARNGYGVLLFDRRGEGASDGDGNLFGWGGDKDVLAAIEFLKSRPDVDPDRIAGIGLSVGAELMLQTAAETDELAAVVSDGAGTRWFAEEMDEFHGVDKFLGIPLLAMKTASVAVFSNTAPPPKLTDLVPRIEQPVFFIYAPDGGVETMSPEYFRLARGPKAIWAIPGVRHMGGFDAHPKEYERRVVAFLDHALANARPGPSDAKAASGRAPFKRLR
jgi:pimeloyl-ACP methyl ester carboxylesterase